MKQQILFAAIWLLTVSLTYGLFAFSFWECRPDKWPDQYSIWFIVVGICEMIVSALAVVEPNKR